MPFSAIIGFSGYMLSV